MAEYRTYVGLDVQKATITAVSGLAGSGRAGRSTHDARERQLRDELKSSV